MQTNTTPKPTRTNKVQRAERCLYVISPSEVETWSLSELFPGYSRCLSCDEPFSPANPAFNSYISYADGSHNEGICRRCSQSRRLAIDSKTILPIRRLWRRAVGSHSPMRFSACCKRPSRHSRNWARPEPAPPLSPARPKLNQAPATSPNRLIPQRRQYARWTVRTISRGASAVFTRLSFVLSFWFCPCVAPGLKAKMHSAPLRP